MKKKKNNNEGKKYRYTLKEGAFAFGGVLLGHFLGNYELIGLLLLLNESRKVIMDTDFTKVRKDAKNGSITTDEKKHVSHKGVSQKTKKQVRKQKKKLRKNNNKKK